MAVLCLSAGPAAAQAAGQTMRYPTEGPSIFTIVVPAGWTATDFEEVGETGSLESKSGSCLQFRAVECDDETAASGEVSSIGGRGITTAQPRRC